jgi:hypothetical protein
MTAGTLPHSFTVPLQSFKFTGKIKKVMVKYVGEPSTSPESVDVSVD